jgi:recombination protein RecA
LALWYQDDASFSIRSQGKQTRSGGGVTGRATICVEAMEPTTRTRLVDYLADTWGIRATLVASGKAQKAILVFASPETTKLHALIAPFVHPSMDYKLLPQFRGRFGVEPVIEDMRYELVAMPVTDIHVKPPARSMHRFDIEVEDSHNYMVDGVVVHNSPEVTPGGRALKFYSSVRLDIRRVEAIKDGADVIGSRTRVKVVKNKCSSPFKVAEFDIMYGTGISREGSLLDVGVELGFIKKSGAWFTYEGEQLGQGRENAKQFLRETPELMIEINEKIRSQLAAVVLPAGAEVGVAANADGDVNGSTVDSDDLPISLKG